jgi:hypothetical protein
MRKALHWYQGAYTILRKALHWYQSAYTIMRKALDWCQGAYTVMRKALHWYQGSSTIMRKALDWYQSAYTIMRKALDWYQGAYTILRKALHWYQGASTVMNWRLSGCVWLRMKVTALNICTLNQPNGAWPVLTDIHVGEPYSWDRFRGPQLCRCAAVVLCNSSLSSSSAYIDDTAVANDYLIVSVRFTSFGYLRSQSEPVSRQRIDHFAHHSNGTGPGPRFATCDTQQCGTDHTSQFTPTNSVAFSPQSNYTDWATVSWWWNLVPTFADRGVSRGHRGGFPTVVNIPEPLLFFQVAPHLLSQGLSGPRSKSTATQKIW